MTTYFHPSNKELARGYGYAPSSNDLDKPAGPWTDLEWSRPFEIACRIVEGVGQSAEPSAEPSTCGMTAADAEYFTRGSRIGFRHIAKRHNLNPTQMWAKVAEGLVTVGMHHDDLDDVQELIFGWKELSAEMLERYRWRYPDRCPLLDVLCTMDETCEELNAVQDWILEIKGSKDRRRLDLLPALPKPDGVRPKEAKDFNIFVKYSVGLNS